MAATNSINLNSNGIVSYNNTTGIFSGSNVTQYDLLIGGASNAISSVGPGSAGQLLQSGGASANPAYSTSTYPATNAINTLLYASSANVMAALATGNNGVLITSSSGVPSWLADGTTGQVLTATTGSPPSWVSPATSGTVTSVSVVSANGFAGTVANASTTPAITLTTSQTGLLSGNGTAITGTAITQYNVITGGASNAPNSVAPSATSGVPLISQGASAQPVFGTAVVAGGGTGVATLTAYELIAAGTTSTGSVQQIGIGTAGQVLTSNGAGSLPSFSAAPASIVWVDVTSSTQAIVAGQGYVTDNATQVTYTLPASPAFGDRFIITGGVSGSATAPWLLAQNALQQIHFGSSSTTVGTGGSLAATLQYDNIGLVCIVAGTSAVWNVIDSVGNITIV